VKEVLQKKKSPALARGVQQNENNDQAASPLQTKKSDSEIVRANEEKFRSCPPETV